MVKRGMVDSREQAQALIEKGVVCAGDRRILKSSTQVMATAELRLEAEKIPYVSRGGLKLESALEALGIDPRGLVAMDVGASTGGFTDCLLQKGAARVYAVDVGYGQLAWRLRQDPRVVSLERTNIRYLDVRKVEGPVDLITIDVSFISLKKVFPKLLEVLKPEGGILALVKPQFEVGKGEVGRGGIVRDRAKQERVIGEIEAYGRDLGLKPAGIARSPLAGKKGNLEFFVYFRRT